MDRRGFLGSILALAAAPAIVRASSLMKVAPSGLMLPARGNQLLTIQDITNETLRVLSKADLWVSFNGVYQLPDSYSISGDTLVFDQPPPRGDVQITGRNEDGNILRLLCSPPNSSTIKIATA